MKKLLMLMIVVFCVLGFVQAATAFVVLTDDLAFGPDAIIRDMTNKNDFLRLDFTSPYSYNQVTGEFGAGGVFEGWTVATTNDLNLLGASAGIVDRSTDPTTLAAAEQLRDWFGHTLLSSTHEYVRGLVADPHSTIAQDAFSIGRRFNVTPNEVDFRISGYASVTDTNEDVFLVRAVPLPGAVWLLGAGLAGIVGLRRKSGR